MGWSLNYCQPKEPELLDEFFLAVGKSLYLASAFESKCKWVLSVVAFATHYEKTEDLSAAKQLTRAMHDQYLGATLRKMEQFPDFSASDVAVLERAKNARNFIAHEAANCGPLHLASAQHLQEQLARLRTEVGALAAGDNIVSRWVYEIEEKGAGPCTIQALYPDWIEQWVFGDVDCE